jgi:hypothetical protein
MLGLSKKRPCQLLAHSLAVDSTVGEALAAYAYPTPAVIKLASMLERKEEFAKRDDGGKEFPNEMCYVKLERRW